MVYKHYYGLTKERISKLALLSIALLFAVTTAIGIFSSASASQTTVTVTESNLEGWEEVNVRGDGESKIDGIPDSQGGNASLRQSFSDSTGKTDFRLLDDFGSVEDLETLSFEWYRDGGSTAPGHLTPAVGVFVDDGDGNSWLLKWEGTYNGYPTSGPAAPTDEWVAENLVDGNYWRIPQTVDGTWVGFGGCNEAGDPYGCFQFNRSLSDGWLDDYNVVGVEIGIGSGWNGTFLSYTDLLTVNDTVYDFEMATLDAPTLVFPENNSVINAADPVANSWSAVDGADFYTYESYNVDMGGACDLSSFRFSADYTDTQTNSRSIADGLSFCWRVQASNDTGVTSDWSELWKVTIDNVAPIAVITSPVDGDTVDGMVNLSGEVDDDNPMNTYFRIEGPDGYVETSLFTDGRTLHEYEWDTTELENGDYTIYFEVRDQAGNKDGTRANPGDSVDVIYVTVNNTDPQTKDECKQGGWDVFGFRNQGQCIRFVNTAKDNRQ